MSPLLHGDLPHLVSTYGYGAVAGIVGLESMGVPLPGETTLIAAAVLAATTHSLDIWLVIVAAASGAILGDNLGFWIGREAGFRLLLRFGKYVRITQARIKLGQYLFLRHGGKVVFFGRFVSVLRALAAFLAGVNRMRWPAFLFFNAAGAIVWACAYGLAAYFLGKEMNRLAGPLGIAIGTVAFLVLMAAVIFLRRHERELEAKAEQALPGPIAR